MNNLNSKSSAFALQTAFLSIALSATATTGFAASYNVTEIPVPAEIKIPSGLTANPVCLSINIFGQVACNLEIIETLRPGPIDRFARTPKLFARYAYVWDSKLPTAPGNPQLLSSTAPDTTDKALFINDNGLVAGYTDTLSTRPQSAIWHGVPGPVTFGPGIVSEINNNGDYVLNGILFDSTNNQISFAGKNVLIEAINNSTDVASEAVGTEAFSSRLGESGIGQLYPVAPSANQPKPWFALSGISSGVQINDLSDNGNFVVSGIPNTVTGLVAFSCTANKQCQSYFPTVGFLTRTTPWISLNAVNNAGEAVGTDGGFALKITRPTVDLPKGTRVDLNSQLQPGAFQAGWFLNEAKDNNDAGNIIAIGLKGSKRVSALLTRVPN